MKNLIKKILRESDELDWIREVSPLPPFPLSEEDLYPLIGWSILYDPHKPYGAWHQNGMTFPITKIQGGNVTWLYDNGKKENYDTITTFLSLINNGTWVLVSPEGVLYDPLYAREWKGGTYYSKEDLNESHEWDWVDEIGPHVSFEDAKKGDRYSIKVLDQVMMEKISDDCSLDYIDENREYEVQVTDKEYLSSDEIYCADEDEPFFEGDKLCLELSFWDVEVKEWVDSYWVTDDLIQLYPII